MSRVAALRDRLNLLLADREQARRAAATERAALEHARQDLEATEQARAVAQDVAKEVQNQAHRQIASVVTRCLQAVFGEDAYTFTITFEAKRGKTEARFSFVRDGVALDPVDAAGGGCVDVAAFALRLAALVLSRPPRRRFLALDEPFRFVSAGYRGRVRQLVEVLAGELGVQFLIVTHSRAFRIGTVTEIE